jgi:hypothetical protein
VRTAQPRIAKQVTAALDSDIADDAAIGDPFMSTTADGVQVKGRITSMRHAGKGWIVDLTISGTTRRGLALPLKAGTRLTWKPA